MSVHPQELPPMEIVMYEGAPAYTERQIRTAMVLQLVLWPRYDARYTKLFVFEPGGVPMSLRNVDRERRPKEYQ